MKRWLVLALVMICFSTPALAVDTDGLQEAVPDSAREILGDITVRDIVAGESFWELAADWCKDRLTDSLSSAARSAMVVLVVTLLCSTAAAVSPDGKMPEYVLLGGALAIMGACAGEMQSFLAQVRTALEELSDFSRALLPCIAGASAAVGKGASGAARYTVSALFLDVLITIGIDVILPAIYAYSAVCTANAALPDGAMKGPEKLMSWLCTALLTALTTVFTVCLSLSGVIAGQADKLTGSVTKSAITAALPVVGKIVADAADVYIAGAKLLRGAVGIFGVAAVLGVCLGPLLGLGLHYLLFKAAACVSEPFADSRLSGLIGNIASCYGMALGLLGSVGIMLFVSVVLGTEVLTG